MTKSLRISKLTLTILVAFAANASYGAMETIPLTLEEARAVAEQANQNAVSIGASYVQANGSSTSAAKTWNGAAKQKGGADVDLHYAGGTRAQGWEVNVEDLGSAIPAASAKYEKASSFDVRANYKRFRHLRGEDVRMVPGSAVLSTPPHGAAWNETQIQAVNNAALPVELGIVRDVYGLNGRIFLADNLYVTADYSLQHRKGTGSIYSTSVSPGWRELPFGISDDHHQFETAVTYKGSSHTATLSYYLSKYSNDEAYMPHIKPDGTIGGFTNLDPSNTLHRVGVDTVFLLG